MQFEFGQDFESLSGQWSKFWAGELSRPMLYAIKPKEGVTPVSKPRPYDCVFGDIDPIVDQTLAWAETHDFPGGAIPNLLLHLLLTTLRLCLVGK